MDIQSYIKGKQLIRQGEEVNRLYVIYRGAVEQVSHGVKTLLGPGTIVGLSDAMRTNYDADYNCMEDVMAIPVYYTGVEDFAQVFKGQPVYIFGFAKGILRQCRDTFLNYKKRIEECQRLYDFVSSTVDRYREISISIGAFPKTSELLDALEELVLDSPIMDWEMNYITSLNEVDNREVEAIYGKREDVVIGIIGICCGFITRAISNSETMDDYLEAFSNCVLSEKYLDLLQMLYDLKVYAAQRRINPEQIDILVEAVHSFIENNSYYPAKLVASRWGSFVNHNFHDDTQAYERAKEEEEEESDDCFAHICEFAGYNDIDIQELRQPIAQYIALVDKEDKEDDARRIRKKASDVFYELYERVFFKSIKTYELSPVVEMFLHFGFVDIDAVGDEIADFFFEMTENIRLVSFGEVYTIYTWLMAIYKGEREPSRNELDLDYRGYITEERKNGNIPEDRVKHLLEDRTEKVKFEIRNFFKSANRTCSGRMSGFCPVQTKEFFGAEPNRMLFSVSKLREALARIENVDFGIFYRERYFTDIETNVRSESYRVRIAPDIVLLPCVGSRAMMWQETGGIKADTPARFVFPMFSLDDLDKMMMTCCGNFRWEICRKEQGSRWNDIGTSCLTSDFYDFFTFYKKNKELSAEHKEKIKNLLKNSRNNMREAFAKEYALWINFEAAGSARLLKPEREMFAKHVPFVKSIRDTLAGHPMYENAINKYNMKHASETSRTKMVLGKYVKDGGVLPDEVREGLRFLDM